MYRKDKANNVISGKKLTGFSLLEFVVVITIISFIVAIGLKYYNDQVENALVTQVEFQASLFSNMASTLRAQSFIKNRSRNISITEIVIYLNEFGWPANTDKSLSPRSSDQTAEECLQLWKVFFRSNNKIAIKNKKKKFSGYQVSSINNNICRYELTGSQDTSYFFDYYLVTGDVIAMTQ